MSDTGGCISCCEICHLNCHGLVGLGIQDFFLGFPEGGLFLFRFMLDGRKMMRGDGVFGY